MAAAQTRGRLLPHAFRERQAEEDLFQVRFVVVPVQVFVPLRRPGVGGEGLLVPGGHGLFQVGQLSAQLKDFLVGLEHKPPHRLRAEPVETLFHIARLQAGLKGNHARVGVVRVQEALQECRFPAAVDPDETDMLAFGHGETDILENFMGAEGFA